MKCDPAVSAIARTALFPLNGTGVAGGLPPSANLMKPVGVWVPLTITVAVKVTDWPANAGFGFAASSTTVGAAGITVKAIA
jgi:hypothetical protein